MTQIYLRKANLADRVAIETAYQRSIELHDPWTTAPSDYEHYLQQQGRYFICLLETNVIVGTFNISNIVRGYFHSAYLGYEAFSPYQNQGFMREGLTLLIEEAFKTLNLHRLEANIQPENTASIRLVERAGFIQEGFSRQYLRVGGQKWKDHQRWAILNEHWDDQNSV